MRGPAAVRRRGPKFGIITAMTDDIDFLRGREAFDNFVRGDAMIGLIADVPGTERAMLDALWAAAGRGSAAAFATLSDCYLAALRPIGAFEGVDAADAERRPWSAEAAAIVDDEPALQATLRALAEAARCGHRPAVAQFARLTRSSSDANKRGALAMLERLRDPSGPELYQRGLVLHWLGELEASHASYLAAAQAGDADAMFELYILHAQGLGVAADAATSKAWLDRAAAADHPRALYNLAAALATGSHGELDLAKAATYYERAANRGNGRAAATLGVMILQHEIDGTKERAAGWLDLADELGFPSWEMLEAVGLDDPRG